jgi:hypothetical protein
MSAAQGTLFFNTSTSVLEFFDGTDWRAVQLSTR